MFAAQKNDISDKADERSENDEHVSSSDFVGNIGSSKTKNGCHTVDWDGHDLSSLSFPSKAEEDSGYKITCAIICIDDSEEYQSAA